MYLNKQSKETYQDKWGRPSSLRWTALSPLETSFQKCKIQSSNELNKLSNKNEQMLLIIYYLFSHLFSPQLFFFSVWNLDKLFPKLLKPTEEKMELDSSGRPVRCIMSDLQTKTHPLIFLDLTSHNLLASIHSYLFIAFHALFVGSYADSLQQPPNQLGWGLSIIAAFT